MGRGGPCFPTPTWFRTLLNLSASGSDRQRRSRRARRNQLPDSVQGGSALSACGKRGESAKGPVYTPLQIFSRSIFFGGVGAPRKQYPPDLALVFEWPSFEVLCCSCSGRSRASSTGKDGSMSLRNAEKLVRPGSWCGTQKCKGALGD